MKVLHASVMSEPAMGVQRQLEDEQEAATELGLPWTTRFYCGVSTGSPIYVDSTVSSEHRTPFKIAFYRWLRAESKKVDVLLLRYSFYDPFQLLFLLTIRKPVYLVHHTLEGPELALNQGLGARLKHLAETVLGSLSLSVATGVVAVTPEILKYELGRRMRSNTIPVHIYPNGIDFGKDANQSIDLDALGDRNANPTLLFVSSVYAPWQGLEELVSAAETYKEPFVCHVVGILTDQQKALLVKDSRFIVHGLLDKAQIAALTQQSDVGLSALKLDKKNMQDACTLKVREYLKAGLPVYAGYNDVFDTDFEFYKNGDVDMHDIVNFAINNKSNDRSLVAAKAKPFIEKRQLLSELYEFMRAQHR